jgi:DNA-binding response OmpR family regulator
MKPGLAAVTRVIAMSVQTILVVDDEQEFSQYVRKFLEQEGFEVIVARDGRTGLSIAQKHQLDLVVLDLTMPDIDGLEVCAKLRADPRRQRLPILVLSARATTADRILGLETGADDYLVKPFDPNELVARVKALLRRSNIPDNPPAVLRVGELTLDLAARKAAYAGNVLTLTAAQFRIMEVLALHAGRVLSRDEIIESALRDDVEVTERTVDVHIAAIRRALGPTAAGCIETVRSFGYVLQPLGSM